MNLTIVYGTRPEFLKLKVLIDQLKITNIFLKVIRINQHTDLRQDNGYYDDILTFNELCDDRISNIGINILSKLPNMITEECTHILAQGDTATTFYSLLVGFQKKKICIHLEAGMRTYDLENPFPEEGFRQMVSRITDIHLCPSEREKNILIEEKVKGKKYVVGNTILDLVKSYDLPIISLNNVIITLHRRENWDDYQKYIESIYQLAYKNYNYNFYFLTHPNPNLTQIVNQVAKNYLNLNNFFILKSLDHKDLIDILSKCSCVITDSGGIQEESNFLGKHIYMLRKVTERLGIPSNKITSVNYENLININLENKNHSPGYEYGDGNTVKKIIKDIFT